MANFTWTTATSGNWDDSSKWTPSGVPDTGDNAFITTSGSYTITLDDDFSPENLTFDDAGGILDIGSHQLDIDTSTTFTAGTITMEGGAFYVGANGMATSAGAMLIGWGAVNDAITGAGTVVAASSHTLELVDEVTDGAAHYDVQASATLQVDDLSSNNVTFSLLGNTGNVAFQENADFDRSTISGLVAGNSTDSPTTNYVYLPFLSFDTVTIELVSGGTGTSGEVFVNYNMGQSKIIFDLTNVQSGGDGWQVEASPDDSGGTQVFLAAVCYAAGTRILTTNGEVPVEQLAPGDLLVTIDRSGTRTVQPIKWIGERRVNLAAHPHPEFAAPVRICKDAFSEGIPARDLLLSPEHCIFVDGRLVPVRLLVNDMTIVQERQAGHVHYYHVEMPQHSLLLAEGLLAESYLDTGNRAFFSNAGLALILPPEFHVNAGLKCWERDACAPLAVGPAVVEPMWRALVHRAKSLGCERLNISTTDDPDLHIVADGKAIRPISIQEDRYLFVIPSGVVTARLASRASVPSLLAPYFGDQRRLGVAVTRISVQASADRMDYSADHPALSDGWFDVESDGRSVWRWTNGNASLPASAKDEPFILEIHVGIVNAYALPSVPPARRIAA